MKNDNFKKQLKISQLESEINKNEIDSKSMEALYLYVASSLDEIFYFLHNFYKDTQSEKRQPSSAESYYYSLRLELSHVYDDFLDKRLNAENFEKQFYDICSHYQTDPLSIYKTSDLIKTKSKDGHNSLVNDMESNINEYWNKMKENSKQRE